MTILLAVIFCVSFVFFYSKQQAEKNLPMAELNKKSEKPLPEAKLFDLNHEFLSDDDLRKGKVVLVFVSPSCEACETEAEFLKNVIEKRKDVKFYGVVSFGKQEEVLKAAQNKFPFRVFYDGNNLLAIRLGITKVPIKIYLEDGIIKKVWGGATVSEDKKSEFINWLESV